MRDLDELFQALAKSTFRSKFRLNSKDLEYLHKKEYSQILSHAEDFIRTRLAPSVIANDGKQTPMRGHPVFVAQHATACCCRSCLYKWHHIPSNHTLSTEEQAYVLTVLERWLIKEKNRA